MSIKPTLIKNPLSIIALFAALSETAGAVVLPLLSPDAQFIFIWFLMLFPTYLVTLFFIVLVFKHEVLYAPSDFVNEENWLKSLRIPNPADQLRKIELEFNESEANISPEAPHQELPNGRNLPIPADGATTSRSNDPISPSNPLNEQFREFHAKALLARDLAFIVLQRRYGDQLTKDSRFEFGNVTWTFDIAAVSSRRLLAIEVLVGRNLSDMATKIHHVARMSGTLRSEMPKGFKDRFRLQFILVAESFTDAQKSDLMDQYASLTDVYEFLHGINVMKFDSLEAAAKDDSNILF